jgi:recombinational DNA repair protein RecT
MTAGTQNQNVVSNLEYDWLTVMHNKAQALVAYDQYIEDARRANSQPCVEFFQRLKESEANQIGEIRQHLKQVMPN